MCVSSLTGAQEKSGGGGHFRGIQGGGHFLGESREGGRHFFIQPGRQPSSNPACLTA